MSQTRRSLGLYARVGCLLLAPAGIAQGGIITSPTYFADIPHTTINFETDGGGNPISLIQGQSLVMPVNAYAARGVTFNAPIRWVNDGNAAFDGAQAALGSGSIGIPSSYASTVDFNFSGTVRAFGLFVVNNSRVDAVGPTVTAYDADGGVIQTLAWGTQFIRGTLVSGNTIADYGYIGLTSSTPIARVVIVKQAALLDDLSFGNPTVPAPASLGALGIAGLLATRRRRA
ncbi:MAG: PEP-CTERM sorting domain-containing protein [Phycisphaerales bacterium]|jgi:hypothetical protein